jgi:hypothetical protein
LHHAVSGRFHARRHADRGSLFDLRCDSAKDIAAAIAGNVGEGKAREISKAIITALNKKQAPAG